MAMTLSLSNGASGQVDDPCSALLFEPNAHLATTVELAIELQDQIKDGCWPRPAAARTAVELEVRRSNIRVVGDDSFLPDRLVLRALGYEVTKTSCVATATLSFRKVVSSLVAYSNPEADGSALHSVHSADIWFQTGHFSGPKNDFGARLKEWFKDTVEQFLLDHQKAQETVFAQCPRLGKRVLEQSGKTN